MRRAYLSAVPDGIAVREIQAGAVVEGEEARHALLLGDGVRLDGEQGEAEEKAAPAAPKNAAAPRAPRNKAGG